MFTGVLCCGRVFFIFGVVFYVAPKAAALLYAGFAAGLEGGHAIVAAGIHKNLPTDLKKGRTFRQELAR